MDLNKSIFVIFWVVTYAVVALGLFIGLMVWVSSFFKKRAEKSGQYKLTFLQIKLPKDNEIEIKAAEQMFASLAGIKKSFFKALFSPPYRISLEIVSKSDGIGFYVITPDDIVQTVERQINAAYPP